MPQFGWQSYRLVPVSRTKLLHKMRQSRSSWLSSCLLQGHFTDRIVIYSLCLQYGLNDWNSCFISRPLNSPVLSDWVHRGCVSINCSSASTSALFQTLGLTIGHHTCLNRFEQCGGGSTT